MERFNGSLIDKLKRSSKARKVALTAAALALTACGSNSTNFGSYPGEDILRLEMKAGQAIEGRVLGDFVVQGSDDHNQVDLYGNGGVNIRISDKQGLSRGLKQTTVVAIAPVGAEISGADEFNVKKDNDAIAFNCTKAFLFMQSDKQSILQDSICYIFHAEEYLQNKNAPTPSLSQ